ncbi:MAG: signal peptidase II [Selenomonadaceae bacterium]|nr:signal peptidase II [Selenomonadaceae bacterium]
MQKPPRRLNLRRNLKKLPRTLRLKKVRLILVEVECVKSVIKFLKNVLLVIELAIYIAYVHLEKVLFVGIIALDQYTKAQVENTMFPGETIPIIQDIFHITYVQNPGAAFGIFPYQQNIFIGLGSLMLIFAAIYYSRLKKINPIIKYGGICAAAGALGNMIDRIRTGIVIDLFDMRIFNFPVFNVADIAIVIGMFSLMYVVIFKSEDAENFKEVRQLE